MKTIYFLCTTAYLLKARGEHTMKKTAAKGWVSGVRFAKSAQHYVQLRCVFTTFLLQTRIVFSCCTTVVMRTDRTCSLRTAGVRGRSLTYGRVHQGGNILPFEDCWYLLKFGHGYRRKALVQLEISTRHREVSGTCSPECYCSFVQRKNRRQSRTPAVSALPTITHRGRFAAEWVVPLLTLARRRPLGSHRSHDGPFRGPVSACRQSSVPAAMDLRSLFLRLANTSP